MTSLSRNTEPGNEPKTIDNKHALNLWMKKKIHLTTHINEMCLHGLWVNYY